MINGEIMRISEFDSEQVIRKELGNRIKRYRISLNITQNQLSEQCGISMSTLMRIEDGDDTKMSNVLKILSAFSLAENINLLIPDNELDYKALFEGKPARQRASSKAKKKKTEWKWAEEDE